MEADHADRASAGSARLPPLLVCFFLSGFAALIYQTAWTRQFSRVFGTSELAIATVLAAYMAGLAAGAALAARLVPRVRRPVLVYGLLELGIALSALSVPAAIAVATQLYVAVFARAGALPEVGGLAHALFYLVSSFATLLVPTALMGATLPLLARHAVRSEGQIGSRVGLLYAINTVGAVCGTVATGFLLLPELGLARTIHVAVAANALVFAAAALLARGARGAESGATQAPRPSERAPGRWILPLILASGAVSFAYEVLWSRLLGHLLGGSIYGFATMLASFLAGIALGSAAAARLAASPLRAAAGFAWAQLGTAALSRLAFALLDRMPELSLMVATSTGDPLFADTAVAAAILLPGALCIGATFPFAVRILARSSADAGPASARVFAWNTCGAIVGAVGAGFFLVPALGYQGMLTLCVVANVALALAATLARPSSRRRVALVAAAALPSLVLLPPAPPWRLLDASPLGRTSPISDDPVYFGVGRSATVLLKQDLGASWRLRSNGLPESAITPRGGSLAGGSLAHWLGALPALARPETRSMLVVGLGGGVALEEIPSSVATIDVVELEPEVIHANRAVAGLRRHDPLADPRVRLVVNDARGALLLGDARYDAIVSQPSHPWTGGAAHLFTREFFALAQRRLEADGALVVWMGLRFVDEALLRSLVATLLDVFPHVVAVHPEPGGILFLASAAPLDPWEQSARAIAGAPAEFAGLGAFGPEDVAVLVALDEAGARSFAEGAPLLHDDRNLLEMRSLAIARSGARALSVDGLFAAHDPLSGPTPGLDRVRLVRRLLERRFVRRARRVVETSDDPAVSATGSGLLSLARRRGAGARRDFERALTLDPRQADARAALLRLRRRAIASDISTAPELPGGLAAAEAAVVAGWRAEDAGDFVALRALETSLAASEPTDPLYPDAMRLRVAWRLATDDRALAFEAARLIDALIPVSRSPRDLLLRCEALLAAGRSEEATVALRQVIVAFPPRRRAVAQRASDLLQALPDGAIDANERQQLAAALRPRPRRAPRRAPSARWRPSRPVLARPSRCRMRA
jgi:spermidine synthase